MKQITERLRCLLTDDEKLAAGKDLAESTNALEELENDKAQVVSDFKAKITAEEAKVAVLSNKLRSGYEYRPVNCNILLDTPEAGRKQIVRDDTHELVREEAMTEEEKQHDLPLNDK